MSPSRALSIVLALSVTLGACDTGDVTGSRSRLIVQGIVMQDGQPRGSTEVRLVEVSHRKVYDTSIQGYHYEEIHRPLGSARTDDGGRYRIEASGQDCEASGAFVEVTWDPSSAVLPLPATCGAFSGLDVLLRTFEVTGTVRLNGTVVEGAPVEWGRLEPCKAGPSSWCFFPNVTMLAAGATAADGSFSLKYADVECPATRRYHLVASLEGVPFGEGSDGCPGAEGIELDVSTLVELGGTVYLDGSPVPGWVGQIVGPAEACNLFTDPECPEVVLASATTDADGTFHVQHVASAFQCQSIYLRATPPEEWEGAAPIAENPPAEGWERGCGSFPSAAFLFVRAG